MMMMMINLVEKYVIVITYSYQATAVKNKNLVTV